MEHILQGSMMTMKYAILYTEHVLQRGIMTMAHAIPITLSGKTSKEA